MIEDQVRMQPRKIRIKNLGYLMLFMTWNVSVITFIMYRLRSDDLDQLEKEAYDRIRISNIGKERGDLDFERK